MLEERADGVHAGESLACQVSDLIDAVTSQVMERSCVSVGGEVPVWCEGPQRVRMGGDQAAEIAEAAVSNHVVILRVTSAGRPTLS